MYPARRAADKRARFLMRAIALERRLIRMEHHELRGAKQAPRTTGRKRGARRDAGRSSAVSVA